MRPQASPASTTLQLQATSGSVSRFQRRTRKLKAYTTLEELCNLEFKNCLQLLSPRLKVVVANMKQLSTIISWLAFAAATPSPRCLQNNQANGASFFSIEQRVNKVPSTKLRRIGEFYYVDFVIGNPPQPVSLTLDTGSSDIWVPAPQVCKNCTYETCKSALSHSINPRLTTPKITSPLLVQVSLSNLRTNSGMITYHQKQLWSQGFTLRMIS